MKQIIPFYKEIVFKTNIASITSMSLEHQETINEGEVTGDFIIVGDYKIHNDTTEKEKFKYKLPFTALIPDDVDTKTVVVDVENFNYEQIDCDVIRVDIDFSIQGEIIKDEVVEEIEDTREELEEEETCDYEILDEELEKIDREIDEILGDTEEDEEVEVLECTCVEDDIRNEKDDMEEILVPKDNKEIVNDNNVVLVQEKVQEQTEEYVHIVSNTDTLENILKRYNVTIDYVKEYNEISEIKVGDKIIIPEYGEQ